METIHVQSRSQTEFVDITGRVQAAVMQLGCSDGVCTSTCLIQQRG